jgi:hypothetical protein
MARNKLDGKGYGFLPENEVQSIPFEEYTLDLIGPWKIQEKFQALLQISHIRDVCTTAKNP